MPHTVSIFINCSLWLLVFLKFYLKLLILIQKAINTITPVNFDLYKMLFVADNFL